MILGEINIVGFAEHPVADYRGLHVHSYEIAFYDAEFIHSGEFGIKHYCIGLLQKIAALGGHQIRPFLEYQTNKMAGPAEWLDSFEKLVVNNRAVFVTDELRQRAKKTLLLIELVRHEISRSVFRIAEKFNWIQVKEKLKEYTKNGGSADLSI